MQPIAPEPSLNRHRTVNKGVKKKFERPTWVPREQWDAYIEMRKKIKKPLVSEVSFNMAVAKLERLKADGHHPAAVLAQSAFNAWQGLFEVKQ